MEKLLNKLPLYKLPFWFKLFWAKCFLRMFDGLGPNLPNDIVLYNELSLWIRTKGRPTTSNINYHLNKIKPDGE